MAKKIIDFDQASPEFSDYFLLWSAAANDGEGGTRRGDFSSLATLFSSTFMQKYNNFYDEGERLTMNFTGWRTGIANRGGLRMSINIPFSEYDAYFEFTGTEDEANFNVSIGGSEIMMQQNGEMFISSGSGNGFILNNMQVEGSTVPESGTASSVPLSYIGNSSYWLGRPDYWLKVHLWGPGLMYIPCYSQS